MATTAGWIGVYNKPLRNTGSQEEAVRKARMATLHTQPAAGVKDVASIYASDNFLSVFLQFSNQLNQNWNQASYDAPMAFVNGNYWQGLSIYAGLSISAIVMWMIANKTIEPPEDREEFFDAFLDQLLASIPVVGKMLASAVDGYNLSVPVLKPVEVGGRLLTIGQRAVNGDDITDVQIERLIRDLYEGLAISVGLLYTEVDRLYKGIKRKQPIQYAIFGGIINDK